MFVYKFIDRDNRIIYVGKTKQSLRKRFYSHNHLPNECYKKVKYIEYIECPTEADMSMKEIYYINQERAKGNALYNIADVSELPQEFKSNDEWQLYTGSLPESFSNSINYTEHYVDEREETIIAVDGRTMKYVCNSLTGVEKYVYPFSTAELLKLFKHFTFKVINARSIREEYSNYKNILLIAIGISTPYKPNEVLDLRYCDLFDEDDEVRGYTITSGNNKYDFSFPMPVIQLLYTFKRAYGSNFINNKEKYVFVGNTGERITHSATSRIILRACTDCDIVLRHSIESLRKTFFRNIYDETADKGTAIEGIEFFSGSYRQTSGRLLKYIDVIPHDHVFNPASFIEDKYIINKLKINWRIRFSHKDKWKW